MQQAFFLTSLLFLLTILFLNCRATFGNKDREAFTDLLQKRKHLNGYWVGKRASPYSDEEQLYDNNDPSELLFDDDRIQGKRASYLVGKRGTYLVGRGVNKRASYLVGRDIQKRDLKQQQ